jgi:hypothetical protein
MEYFDRFLWGGLGSKKKRSKQSHKMMVLCKARQGSNLFPRFG